MAKIGSITDVLSNVRAHSRTASDASPQREAESYSQPNVPGNQNAQAPASSYPAEAGFLGNVPGQNTIFIGQDPYGDRRFMTVPVTNCPGDSPIIKTPAPFFNAQDPYSRPDGVAVSPADPRDASPTRVSYSGSHE